MNRRKQSIPSNTLSIRATAVVAAMFPWVGAVYAGDLNPPAGPVAQTHKTLTEVEPRKAIKMANTPGDADSVFKITQPGSYYLTGDVTGVAGKHGIEVDPTIFTAVTIDLNGFVLQGVAGSLDGITGFGTVNVRNGTVEEWDGAGIFVLQGRVEDIRARLNGMSGIHVSLGSTISRCESTGNAGDGLFAGDTTQVSQCISKNNDGWGLHVDGACTVRDCIFYANELGGLDTGLSIVRDSLFFSNVGPAISDRGFSTIAENQVNSGSTGILALATRSRIEKNVVTDCVKGIDVNGTGNIIIGNTCTECTTHYEFPLGILNTVGEILSFPSGGVVTSHNPWANFEY